MADKSNPGKRDDRELDASPYGPQHQVDDAAGGADSSPYETMSSDELQALAEGKRIANLPQQTASPDNPKRA
jgi:hypothetical protein